MRLGVQDFASFAPPRPQRNWILQGAVPGLVDGGCDLLMIETIFDTQNTNAATFVVDEYFE